MDKTLVEETAHASRFPQRPVNPKLESSTMKNKQTETKFEIWHWSHTSFIKRGTVFSSNQSNLRARVGAESVFFE